MRGDLLCASPTVWGRIIHMDKQKTVGSVYGFFASALAPFQTLALKNANVKILLLDAVTWSQ